MEGGWGGGGHVQFSPFLKPLLSCFLTILTIVSSVCLLTGSFSLNRYDLERPVRICSMRSAGTAGRTRIIQFFSMTAHACNFVLDAFCNWKPGEVSQDTCRVVMSVETKSD